MPAGARVQASCEGGRWAAWFHVSPLWTLQRLCFGPNVAAANADRAENRDPGMATTTEMGKTQLTREARLENGACLGKTFLTIPVRLGCSRVSGLSARHARPLALMESASLVPNDFPHSKCRTLIGFPKPRSQPLPSPHRFLPIRRVSAPSFWCPFYSQAADAALCR